MNIKSDFHIIPTSNAQIMVQSFGDSSLPPLILIMGATASMDWWDTDFCLSLAAAGFYVIRYDNRDVGQSTYYPAGEPSYDIADMVDDLFALMDFFDCAKTHLFGMSLGGMIAQIAAIKNPDKIASLTLLATSPWDDLPNLPSIAPAVLTYLGQASQIDWDNKQQAIDYITGSWKMMAGSKYAFDENRIRKIATIEVERASHILSRFNHALVQGCEDLYGQAKNIHIPTIILHGTEDPVLPFAHGEALQKTIHNAKLIPLSGVGHELPAEIWEEVITVICKNT